MKRKLITIISLLALVFIFSSCSAGLNDKMLVDKDFKGERVINISIEKSFLSDIKGGIPALSQLLKEEVKDPLTIDVITETDNLLEVNIKMKFDGIDDYKQKVESLYKMGNIEETPSIDYLASNRVFEDDIYFAEDVTGKKLVKYLIDASVNKGLIEAGKTENIWSNYKYSFSFKNRELLTSSQVPFVVKEKNYLGPSLYLVTSSKSRSSTEGKNLWNRNFNLVFSRQVDSQLDKDWATKLIKDPDVLATRTRSSIKYKGEDYILYQFQLKDRSIEEISSISAKIIQSSNELDLSIRENPNILSIDYHFYEKYKDLDDRQGVDFDFIYYKEAQSGSQHFPKNLQSLDDRSSLTNTIGADKKALEEGFDYRKSEKASFDQAEITLYIFKDKELKRQFSIKKNKRADKKIFNKLLQSFLEEKDISYDSIGDSIDFSYGPKNFQETNKFFFIESPKIKQKFYGLFTDEVNYYDKANLKNIQIGEIKQYVRLSPGLKLIKADLNAGDSQIDNLIVVKENEYIPRIFYLLAPLVIFLAIISLSKGKKDIQGL